MGSQRALRNFFFIGGCRPVLRALCEGGGSKNRFFALQILRTWTAPKIEGKYLYFWALSRLFWHEFQHLWSTEKICLDLQLVTYGWPWEGNLPFFLRKIPSIGHPYIINWSVLCDSEALLLTWALMQKNWCISGAVFVLVERFIQSLSIKQPIKVIYIYCRA